jgi:hypothetical protein
MTRNGCKILARSSKGTNVRSTDEKFFSHDASTRHADVTDSDLFSDMVAQQVLDACNRKRIATGIFLELHDCGTTVYGAHCRGVGRPSAEECAE